jgi:hypothetical protein
MKATGREVRLVYKAFGYQQSAVSVYHFKLNAES